jgi:two-component system, sensor histidine kinase and response regulator
MRRAYALRLKLEHGSVEINVVNHEVPAGREPTARDPEPRGPDLHAKIASVLVVDDVPENLQLLVGLLRQAGFRPRPVTSGQLALQAARSDPPDLVLLDIRMPGMDGYEVCRELKADRHLADIPVIFISAFGELADKVKGFSVGGVDYVTKPFQFDEVKARISTHLELRNQRHQLQASYEKLKRTEELRDSLVHMIIHDLRSPLTALSAFLKDLQDSEEHTVGEFALDIEHAQHAVRTMVRIIANILDVSKAEAGMMEIRREQCDLVHLVEQALEDLGSLVGRRDIAFDHPSGPVPVMADGEIIVRVIENLLSNALRLTPASGSIHVEASLVGMDAKLVVADTGPGVPEELRERIFEKFVQIEGPDQRRRYSSGLGLSFCKMAIGAHAGRIGVDSTPGRGSTFWFTLPSDLA